MNIKEILKDKYKTDRFIEDNKGLAYDALKKTFPSIINTYDEQDYIQEGLLGIYKAMTTFDESKGIAFNTYAWIIAKRRMIQKFKCEKNKIKLYDKNVLSLNKTVKSTLNNEECSLMDLLKSKTDIELFYETKESKEESKEKVEKIVENLNKRIDKNNKKVLDYLIYENKTQSEISRELGVSRQRVSQIVNQIRLRASKMAI